MLVHAARLACNSDLSDRSWFFRLQLNSVPGFPEIFSFMHSAIEKLAQSDTFPYQEILSYEWRLAFTWDEDTGASLFVVCIDVYYVQC